MEFVILLFVVIVGGCWLIGVGLGKLFFPERKDSYNYPTPKKHNTTINHYKTENHLHISKEDLEELINKNKT